VDVVRRSSLIGTVSRVAPWHGLSRAAAALLPLLIAAWFGRSAATDLYSLVGALFALAGSLVFSCFKDSALVPILMDVERRQPGELPRLVGAVLAYTLVLASSLAVLVGVAAFAWFRGRVEAPLAASVAPMALGFSLHLFVLALRSLFSTLLAARFRFVADAVGAAAGAATTVGLAVALHGRGLAAIPFALVGGELVAAALLFRSLRLGGLRAPLNWRRSAPLARLAGLVASEIGGAAVVQVNPLVDQLMAQALGVVGGGTMLRLSGDLGHAGTSLLGPVFLSILLSHLASAGAAGDHRSFTATLRRSLWTVTAALGALALLGFVFRVPLVRLVYGRGAMDAAALARMSHLLPYHLLGLAPLGALMVLARAHVSLGNSRILVGMGALNASLNVMLNGILSRPLGLEGIALSTSIVSLVVAIVFWRRLEGLVPTPFPVAPGPAAPSPAPSSFRERRA
jgi:putative peptidoglycan lipid II flippase